MLRRTWRPAAWGALAAPPPPAGPVALRFVPAGWHLEEDTRIVEQLQQEHPRITVTREPIPSDYVDKITALQVAGQLPDVRSSDHQTLFQAAGVEFLNPAWTIAVLAVR